MQKSNPIVNALELRLLALTHRYLLGFNNVYVLDAPPLDKMIEYFHSFGLTLKQLGIALHNV